MLLTALACSFSPLVCLCPNARGNRIVPEWTALNEEARAVTGAFLGLQAKKGVVDGGTASADEPTGDHDEL